MRFVILLTAIMVMMAACTPEKTETMEKAFLNDFEFLKKHTSAFLLKNGHGGQAIVVPEYQGRIMTSTIDGNISFGWINRELIDSGIQKENFNPYGGEDRFWLGPEGGQFSLFHKPGGPFDLSHWVVPEPIDKRTYELKEKTDSTAIFVSSFQITNYSGTGFFIEVERKLRMIPVEEGLKMLNLQDEKGIRIVGFESENRILNRGDSAWTRERGLISVWILGMFNPGENAKVIIPYFEGGEGSLGAVVNDNYFGKVPSDRLHVSDGIILFKADGKYRSKIGLSWKRAKNILGSFDSDTRVLTVVQYNKPEEEMPYLKSMWEIMTDPYNGDVINSFNDGPATPGAKPLGPFYELETSSPVQALAPGDELTHIHRTFHIQASDRVLSRICEKLFGIKLQEMEEIL